VVTNAIVVVDLISQYRTRGMKVTEAIINGSSRRLRPILMTAIATICAAASIIGLTGHGGFISQPLAIVVIGGARVIHPAHAYRAAGALLRGRGCKGTSHGSSCGEGGAGD
jgi:HAE1 family hydrophobic/amphiphilic exporter-1